MVTKLWDRRFEEF